MAKHLNEEQWIYISSIQKKYGIDYAISQYILLSGSTSIRKTIRKHISKKIILIDNNDMNKLDRKKGSGRPKKRDDSDIPSIIDELTEAEKREILEHWIKEKRDEKDKNSLDSYSILRFKMKYKILKMHRTTLYKKKKNRTYKFDKFEGIVNEVFTKNMGIYGSRKIVEVLSEQGISISDRTMRNYMQRWNLATKTRVKRRKSEQKDTTVKIKDLVKRNYNPIENNVIATDVSYIPANVIENHVYLSAAINHKTKMIESWKISNKNDTNLVLETINDIGKTDFILHSDHGSQYSSQLVKNRLLELNAISSMGRVGNSLDNREIEYFFGCLKGEYLNHLKTHTMNFNTIKNHIKTYIDWYNNNRIQKRLQWKTPAYASAFSNL